MTRKELIEMIAHMCSIPTSQAARFLDTTIGVIKHELIRRRVVALPGFGTFGVKELPAREGTNPRTGERIQIGARKIPYFTAGRAFKEACNR